MRLIREQSRVTLRKSEGLLRLRLSTLAEGGRRIVRCNLLTEAIELLGIVDEAEK